MTLRVHTLFLQGRWRGSFLKTSYRALDASATRSLIVVTVVRVSFKKSQFFIHLFIIESFPCLKYWLTDLLSKLYQKSSSSSCRSQPLLLQQPIYSIFGDYFCALEESRKFQPLCCLQSRNPRRVTLTNFSLHTLFDDTLLPPVTSFFDL